ncbi:MAG: protein kinase [Candidatus Solibacter sp.]
MSPERWQKVEGLYHAALEKDAKQRIAFLAEQADGDEELLREVESLIAKGSGTGSLDLLAWNGAASLTETASGEQLPAGTKLGPYLIEGLLGAGGMGQVYKARDTRLDRPVAIKVSNQRFSNRFEREARSIAALNHPHICTLYDVGPNYLVMELVEGESLESRQGKGRLALEVVLRYGAQIAGALASAHARGIVHRDLKPGNIMVTKSGIKVLDFGLAKQIASDDGLTATHAIIGTPAYMAPEQMEGKPSDIRTDIFALGLVLYEMAAGKRLPIGQNKNLGLEGLPPQFAHVVRRCLDDDPDNRWQSARDLKAELEWTANPDDRWQTASDLKRELPGNPAPAGVRAKNAPTWMWPAMAGLTCIAAIASAGYFSKAPNRETVVRSAILPPDKGAFNLEGKNGPAAVSPDGNSIAFVATVEGRSSLWVRSLHDSQSRELPKTEGGYFPFWSPDSLNIGFFENGSLRRIQVAGGSLETICAVQDARGGSWGANGDIIFANSRRSAIYRVSASGGDPIQVTRLQELVTSHRWPSFLPDGKHFLYHSSPTGAAHILNEIRFASLDGKEDRPVMKGKWSSNATFAAGRLVYFKMGSLFAQPFDAVGGKLSGEAVRLADSVNFLAWFSAASFSVSEKTLVFEAGGGWSGGELTWFDASGKEIGQLRSGEQYSAFRISPDEKKVLAIAYSAQGTPELWTIDVERGGRTPAVSRVQDSPLAWSPDSKSFLYTGEVQGSMGVFKKSVYGTDVPQRVLTGSKVLGFADWSPDGHTVAFAEFNSRSNNYHIWLAPASGEGNARILLNTPFTDARARFSSDGKWLTFDSDDTGGWEVYAVALQGATRRWQISSGGGTFPVWSFDGRTIYYETLDAAVAETPVLVRGEELVIGKSRRLFQPPFKLSPNRAFDVGADGRFLVAVSPKAAFRSLTLVANWASELSKK